MARRTDDVARRMAEHLNISKSRATMQLKEMADQFKRSMLIDCYLEYGTSKLKKIAIEDDLRKRIASLVDLNSYRKMYGDWLDEEYVAGVLCSESLYREFIESNSSEFAQIAKEYEIWELFELSKNDWKGIRKALKGRLK